MQPQQMELEAEQRAQCVVENAFKSSAACLLHPARTMLQAFPRTPFISLPSRIFEGSSCQGQPGFKHADPVLYWREGNAGSLELHLSPLALHMDSG